MSGFLSLDTLLLPRRRRKRETLLARAAAWPVLTAKLLRSTVVAKDPLAEGGTAFQEFQIESAFYFTLDGGYFGGHLRSVPLSDGEAHRFLRDTKEDTLIQVRYNPENPDQNHTLAADNGGVLPFAVWSS